MFYESLGHATHPHINVISKFVQQHAWVMQCGYKKSKLETKWTRDLSKVRSSDFEAVLQCYDWSKMYEMSDPDEAADFLTENVLSALNKVAPLKLI